MNEQQKAILFARTNLLAYSLGTYNNYEIANHHKLIAKKLHALEERKIRKLMVFLPPRHGKTLLISQIFPSWYLGKHPDHQVIFTTYNQEFAGEIGRRVRNHMSDDPYKAIFPNIEVSDDSSSNKRFHTNYEGAFYAVGAGGPLTGRGGHLIIIDDIHKSREEAHSEVIRKNIHDWFGSTLYSRRMTDAVIILVQTRWHEDDLPGKLLAEQGDEWDVLSLPALDENNNALWPEKFSVEDLLQTKNTMGARDFEALYQQRPTALEGNIILRDWIRYYNQRPEKFDELAIFADLTFKEGQDTDFTVVETWGRVGTQIFLVDQIRGRKNFPAQLEAIREMKRRFPEALAIEIEEAANGAAVIETLKAELMGLVPIKPRTSKEARLHAVSPLFQSGNVNYPNERICPWVITNLNELLSFPNAKHDDTVDVCTMALTRLGTLSRGLQRLEALSRR